MLYIYSNEEIEKHFLIFSDIFATGFSDRTSVIHEHSECNIYDAGSDFKTISENKDNMYCASHCTTNDRCQSFEYNSVNAVCRLFINHM